VYDSPSMEEWEEESASDTSASKRGLRSMRSGAAEVASDSSGERRSRRSGRGDHGEREGHGVSMKVMASEGDRGERFSGWNPRAI
jgi:hypothetical protein